jgi:MATE family multidrug resistance protein
MRGSQDAAGRCALRNPPMSTWRFEARRLTTLAAPIAVTQLATMLLWTIDFLMVGKLGVPSLNAVALGRLYVIGTAICAMGLICGQDAISAQAHGARNRERLGGVLLHSLALAIAVSVPLAGVWLLTERVLLGFGQDPVAAALAHDYVVAQIPSLPFFLLFVALKQYLQTRGIVRPEMWIAIGTCAANAFLNWIFIYGNLGAPRMGVVGAAVATAISQVLMFGAMLAAFRIYRLQRGSMTVLSPLRLRWRGIGEIVRLGLPLAAMFALEYWAFATATLWAGRLGTTELAAHSIAINLASITYMIPLGIGLAATTRVGNLVGAGDPGGAQRSAWVALALGGSVMGLCALAFVLCRHWIPTWYTLDPAVVLLAASLLPIAAAFQLFDGLQVVGSGVLRGMGRTRPAAAFNLIGFYVLGLPIAWWLARPERLGLSGIWWGLAAGLFAVALLAVYWVGRFGPKTARALVR